jgi:AhpC/TSA family
MTRMCFRFLAGLAIVILGMPAAFPASASATSAAKQEEPLQLRVGDTAPDFSLLAFDGSNVKKVSLADYRGKKNVALAFYVFAFTGG